MSKNFLDFYTKYKKVQKIMEMVIKQKDSLQIKIFALLKINEYLCKE